MKERPQVQRRDGISYYLCRKTVLVSTSQEALLLSCNRERMFHGLRVRGFVDQVQRPGSVVG
jgi:hypothetical protein